MIEVRETSKHIQNLNLLSVVEGEHDSSPAQIAYCIRPKSHTSIGTHQEVSALVKEEDLRADLEDAGTRIAAV